MSFGIYELTTDGLKNPAVIDEKKPVFAWKLFSDRENTVQESCRIRVGTAQGLSDMWDSGEIISDVSEGIIYAGRELEPCTEYAVRVDVKSNFGESAEYESIFETAFLNGAFSCWDGAEFIGAPEYYVCSEALGVFGLESELTVFGFGRAGIVFGADDYRLENRERNEMLIEGENYISVCIAKNASETALEIYRVGYSLADKKDVLLDRCRLPKEAEGKAYGIQLEVTGNCVSIHVNGVFIKRVCLNPLGDNDVTTYPHLGNIGYYADAGTKAHFSGIRCRFLREPSNVFYACDTENGIDICGDCEKGRAAYSGKGCMIKRTPDCHALPMFRRNFTVGKAVKKARLYVTARGIYECRINGKEISDEYFAPGASQYDRHLYYQTYDITELLHQGENGIGFTLASGWWSGSQTFVLGCYHLWGDKESVMAKMVIAYADGSSDTIVTNTADWDYYGEGPYKFAGFFQGERLDGREAEVYYGFSKPDFLYESDSANPDFAGGNVQNRNFQAVRGRLKKPIAVTPDIIPEYDALPGFFRKYPEMNRTVPILTGKSHCPVRAAEEITAVGVTSPAEGVYIYDLGQEIAGICRIRFHGKRGETAVIRYAEMLYPDLPEYGELTGRLLTANLRDAASTDKYILRGEEGEIYSPRFTFHGFRYIEISGVENPPEVSEVFGIQLSSIREITGKVETDNAALNRFVKNVRYSQLCNFISIPTDCPQRNERMGWAGDAHVFCKTANLNADVKAFYLRYLEALRDCQEENGNLPEIAPVGGGFGGIAYGSAMAFIVNDLYNFYGDVKIISDNYPAMKRYMEYLAEKELPGAADMGPIDDWLAPEKTDSNLVWNAFYGRDCGLMARFAGILKRAAVEKTQAAADEAHFTKRLEEAKEYFNRTFFDSEKGVTLNMDGTVNDTMGGYAIGLAYEMFCGENLPKAQKRLAEKAAQSGYKITTGFFGTGLVNPMLSAGGFGEEAYHMLTQTEFPSWLYPVTQGATTIWERWDSYTAEKGFGGMNAMNSFNHYSFGSVLSWLYEYALGIRQSRDSAGWKRFIIKPDFAGFRKISGGFETSFGRIESEYEITDGTVRFSCRIPVNTHAEILLPGIRKTVGSGSYTFVFSLKEK